jgi:hypothetical protein
MISMLWVGESWGENELTLGHPFVGSAGQELARIGVDAGIITVPLPWRNYNGFYDINEMVDFWQSVKQQDGIQLSNVFHAHPENNNIENFFGIEGDRHLPPLKAGKYILPEFMPHVQNLWNEIEILKPNVVVCLGNTPSWALLGRSYISRIRGAVAWSDRCKCKVVPTYHPSYIIRGQWPERPIVIADLQKAKRQSISADIHRPEVWILRDPTIPEIADWFTEPATEYAVDIETGYALYSKAELKRMTPKERYFLSSQISMISFARTENDVIVIEFMSRKKPDLCYWPTLEEEVEVWKLIKHGLRIPIKKVFQNGLYDMGRCLEAGIITWAQGMEDTMLRQHARYPEMLKSLGFQASLFVDDLAWKEIYSNRESLKRDE